MNSWFSQALKILEREYLWPKTPWKNELLISTQFLLLAVQGWTHHTPGKEIKESLLMFLSSKRIDPPREIQTCNTLYRYVTTMRWSAWWRSPSSCRRSSGSSTWTRPGRCSPPTESPKRPHPNWRPARCLRRSDVPQLHHRVLSVSVILGFSAHLKYLCK